MQIQNEIIDRHINCQGGAKVGKSHFLQFCFDLTPTALSCNTMHCAVMHTKMCGIMHQAHVDRFFPLVAEIKYRLGMFFLCVWLCRPHLTASCFITHSVACNWRENPVKQLISLDGSVVRRRSFVHMSVCGWVCVCVPVWECALKSVSVTYNKTTYKKKNQ